ncbi:hypothetical protein GCM10025854_23200 [Tetragenococcus muriaticus]|nr:hypothetical protein GCM10025854_23200 [Tetragenococcus muriaticus]
MNTTFQRKKAKKAVLKNDLNILNNGMKKMGKIILVGPSSFLSINEWRSKTIFWDLMKKIDIIKKRQIETF